LTLDLRIIDHTPSAVGERELIAPVIIGEMPYSALLSLEVASRRAL